MFVSLGRKANTTAINRMNCAAGRHLVMSDVSNNDVGSEDDSVYEPHKGMKTTDEDDNHDMLVGKLIETPVKAKDEQICGALSSWERAVSQGKVS